MTERLMSQAELEKLVARFGEPHRQTHAIDITQRTYRSWMRKITTGPVSCRGEVIMVIVRPNGTILVHTKDFYPPGVYRLPSGRVLWNEKVQTTLRREVTEETNLDVGVEDFLGLIEYAFCCHGNTLPFVSYLFHLEELGGDLRCRDHNEGITDFREASIGEFPALVQHLENLEPPWHDWGQFRAIAHRVVHNILGT